MSELIDLQQNRTIIRRQLLCAASAVALAACISKSSTAYAEDADRPTMWIELGGQLEFVQGTASPFTAPFMTAISPTPAPYRDDIFEEGQKPPRSAFGLEGKVTFQPEESDWKFSAGVIYGRSQSNRHIHHQTDQPIVTHTFYLGYPIYASYIAHKHPSADTLADTTLSSKESHLIVDFQVGKDVGLGIFGERGSSTVNVGVRFAQFQSRSSFAVNAIPSVSIDPFDLTFKYALASNFHGYTMHAHAARTFHGVGPSLSWNASKGLAGNAEDGELALDWGINASLLFGRQKAKVDHNTHGYHIYSTASGKYQYYHHVVLPPNNAHSTRSHSVVVPNVGGFAGLSVKYPNAKVSLGYRADFFFGAVDAGIDVRRTRDLGFHGPFATISLGLGR